MFLDMPVSHWLRTQARQAVQICPSLALKPTDPAPSQAAELRRPPASRQPQVDRQHPSGPDLKVSEEWIAELSEVGRQIPRPIR